MSRIKLPCVDCGLDVYAHAQHPYMVHDELWHSVGMGTNDGHLCIPCLETRLGRILTPDDFTPGLPCNDPNHWRNEDASPILLARLGGRTVRETQSHKREPSSDDPTNPRPRRA